MLRALHKGIYQIRKTQELYKHEENIKIEPLKVKHNVTIKDFINIHIMISFSIYYLIYVLSLY